MGILILAINLFFKVMTTLILVYCILSWFCPPNSGLYSLYVKLSEIVEPIMAPWRRLTQGLTYRIGVDFTPVIAIFVLQFINRLLVMILIRF